MVSALCLTSVRGTGRGLIHHALLAKMLAAAVEPPLVQSLALCLMCECYDAEVSIINLCLHHQPVSASSISGCAEARLRVADSQRGRGAAAC
eukprot:1273633-Rhodomonas_salina.2